MIKKLKFKDVRTDGGTQSRKNIDPNWVKNYAENMKEGAKFPPPVAFYDGDEYWLGDGFHRMAAMKSIGLTEGDFEVIEGTLRQAKLYSIEANNFHGRNMTPGEKRDNIIFMIKDEEYGKWSDKKIAQINNVSTKTVFRIRQKLIKENQVAPKTETKYIDKHGNEKVMNTTSLAKTDKPTEEKPTEEKPPKEEPAEEPEEKELTKEEVEQMEMPHTIAALTQENEKLKEQVALGLFEGNEFEKLDIQEMLADLREKNRILELENQTLRESRDTYQYENAQMIKEIKTLRAKLKKAGVE